MTSIMNLFEWAQIAEASYSLFDASVYGNQVELKRRLLIDNKSNFEGAFSDAEATEFIKHWRVVYHQPNVSNGFSSTLFESVDEPGKYLYALRGTEGFLSFDFLAADLGDIAIDGLALDQIVSMYNDWKRITALSNQPYTAARLETLAQETSGYQAAKRGEFVTAFNMSASEFLQWLGSRSDIVVDEPLALVRRVSFASSDTVFSDERKWGAGLSAASEPGRLEVAGHSLGGHLAVAFSRLFPELAVNAVSVNGAGFSTGGLSTTGYASLNIRNLFGMLFGSQVFDGARIYNVYGDSGPEIVTQNGPLLFQQGAHQPIYIESLSLSTTLGHGSAQMTDSLAIYNILAKVDPTLNTSDPAIGIGKITDILRAMAFQPTYTLEAALDSIRRLFKDPSGILTTTAVGDREQFYRNIYEETFQNRIAAYAGSVSIESLTDKDYTALQANAFANIAYRYALQELNPFALLGDTGVYAQFNSVGELDVHDPVNRIGALTSEWIADRAAFLAWKNQYFISDGITLHSDRSENFVFENRDSSGATNVSITVVGTRAAGGDSGASANPAEVAFGNAGVDVLTGGILSDRLYAGAETDWLEGRAGNDYLEGGSGVDLYHYSTINTSLVGNDGADVIRDIDGKGILRLTNLTSTGTSIAVASSAVRLSGSHWLTADGNFTYTITPNDQGRTDLLVETPSGGSVLLKDWQVGDFGIQLWAPRTPPEITGATVTGDLQPQDFDPNTDGIQMQLDALGNIIVTATSEPDREDVLNDSAGNDRLIGLGGNDILRGIRDGADWMSGGDGRDDLAGGGGTDLIEGGGDGVYGGEAGGDIAFGDVGNDDIYADTSIQLIEAITLGDATPPTNAKGEYLSGGSGDDWIVSAAANDYLDGGSGQDLIVGGAGDDNITGDYGFAATTPLWVIKREITQQGELTVHALNFESGSIAGLDGGAGGADAIYAGAGADWVAAGDGEDYIDGGPGENKMWGESGSDVLIGGDDNDLLVGDNPTIVTGAAEGSDYLDGGAGDDNLQGDGASDILMGGPGNDTLSGGAGRDIYVFNKGDGTETVFDSDTTAGSPDASVLVFGDGIFRDAIKFKTGSLAIDIGASDPADPSSPHDVIHFSGFNQIDPIATTPVAEIRFSDGSVMGYEDILAQGFDIEGTSGDDNGAQNLVGTGVNDRILGMAGNDLLFGLRGDDLLDGADGVDQLVGGPGNDTIYGGAGHDEIWGDAESGGIFAPDGSDVIYAGSGDDVVSGHGGADQIFGEADSDVLYGDDAEDVLDGGAGDDYLYGQGVYFLDGIPFQNLFDDAAADVLNGGDGNDYLDGAAGSDVLDGGSGADNLLGDLDSDHLVGGDGDDTLWADNPDSPLNQGADTLEGGFGDDIMIGYAGDDTYVFSIGYGTDVIYDQDATAGNIDRIVFGPGIDSDAVNAFQSGAELVLEVVQSSDSLHIANHFVGPEHQIEQIEFADGAAWTSASIPLTIRGSAGNDTLNGTTGPNIFEGLAGNDTMSGGAGNDVYRIYRADGADLIADFDNSTGNVDRIVYWLDIAPGDIVAQRSGNNLVLGRTGTTDQVTVANYFLNDGATPNSVEEIKFLADGTVWNVETIKQAVLRGTDLPNVITGYSTNDFLSGLAGNDTLVGNAGSDTLIGGGGDDLLQGGAGNDTYIFVRYDGRDTITDIDTATDNTDTIFLEGNILHTEVQAARLGNDLVLNIDPSGNQITVSGYFENDGATPSVVERVEFAADGEVWDLSYIKQAVIAPTVGNDVITGYASNDYLIGIEGDDALHGAGGDDTLAGGAGDDQLFGEAGSDIYLFNRGDGADLIVNGPGDGVGTIDALSFSMDISPDDITATRNANDLFLTVANGGGQVRIQNYFQSGTNVVEEIRFADGTVWTEPMLLGLLPPPPVAGTEADDILRGTTGDELLRGLGGDDTIYGGGGSDTFEGGIGADWLYGSAGNDTYLLNIGEGYSVNYAGDLVNDTGGYDALQLGSGIAPSDPYYWAYDGFYSGNRYLWLDVPDTPGGVYLLDYWGAGHIEEIRFADGTVWTDQTFASVFSIIGSGSGDVMFGTALADVIYGSGGNDTIYGGLGHDSLNGELGSDQIYGDGGDDLLTAGNGDSKKAGVSNSLYGGPGDDVLVGSNNVLDHLYGEAGNDILIGGTGRVWLEDTSGSNLMLGSATSDFFNMGDQRDLVIGAGGDDFIDGDNSNINGIFGREVLLYNKGDGTDSISRIGSGSTISIGGALYSNLSFASIGTNLQLKVGTGAMNLGGWYESSGGKSVSTLQLIIEGTRDYNPASADPLHNRKVQAFDFQRLVEAFDSARAAGQKFSLASALANAHLWGSDTEAIGGAVAYEYGRVKSLSGLSYEQMREVIRDASFGIAPQAIGSQSALVPAGSSVSPDISESIDSRARLSDGEMDQVVLTDEATDLSVAANIDRGDSHGVAQVPPRPNFENPHERLIASSPRPTFTSELVGRSPESFSVHGRTTRITDHRPSDAAHYSSNELLGDDEPRSSMLVGNDRVKQAASHTARGDDSNDEELTMLANGWFEQARTGKDLSLLDDIVRGGDDGLVYLDDFSSRWHRSHRWLKSQGVRDNYAPDASIDGAYTSLYVPGRDAMPYELARSPIGLNGVSGHDLKQFTGLKEGISILAQ